MMILVENKLVDSYLDVNGDVEVVCRGHGKMTLLYKYSFFMVAGSKVWWGAYHFNHN